LNRDLLDLAEESTRGGLILVSGTVISAIISALASILIARFLGPEDYGLYALALVIPQIFFLITDFGIKEGIVKFSIESRERNQIALGIKIIKYGLLIRSLAALFSFIFIFFTADSIATTLLNRSNLGFYVRIASLSIIFQALYSTTIYAYIGLDKVTSSSIVNQIQSLSKAIISVLLLALGFGLTGAVFGYVFGFIVAGLIGTITLLMHFKKYDQKNKIQNVNQHLKLLIKYGTPLYFSTMLIGLMPQLIDVILSFFSSNFDIGNFKVTANFIVLMTLVTQQITTSFLPVFTKLSQSTTQKYRNFFYISLKFTTLIMIPIATVLIIFSKDIVQLIYGTTYGDAGLYLAIYSMQFFFTAFGLLNLPSLFNGLGKTKETLKMNFSIFIVVMILAPFATKFFGIIGLIISILIGYGFGSLYGMVLGKRIFGLTINLKVPLKIFFASLLSAFPSTFLFSTFLSPILKIILGLILFFFLYITLIPLTRAITNLELDATTNLVEKISFLIIIKPILRYQKRILNFSERFKS